VDQLGQEVLLMKYPHHQKPMVSSVVLMIWNLKRHLDLGKRWWRWRHVILVLYANSGPFQLMAEKLPQLQLCPRRILNLVFDQRCEWYSLLGGFDQM